MRPKPRSDSGKTDRRALGQAKLLTAMRASLKDGAGIENLGFARLDHGREARNGFPEVVFGEGKTPEQIAAISGRILARSGRLLITRVEEPVFLFLKTRYPVLRYHHAARAVYHEGSPALRAAKAMLKGHVVVASAGTSDLPVAEEAALTARMLGCQVTSIHDIGVAGLHRLLAELPRLR